MDALIPILFAIAYFIFQAYTGYQEEQKKAARRNIGKPNPEVYKPEPAATKPSYDQPSYEKPVFESPYIEKPYVQTYQEPVYESAYREEKYVPTERPVNLLEEYRRLASADEDVLIRRSREARKAKRSGIKRLETERLEIESAEREANRFHFDMRQAVIMKAILDRPHT